MMCPRCRHIFSGSMLIKQQCFCLEANKGFDHIGILECIWYRRVSLHRDLLASIESHKLIVFKTVLVFQKVLASPILKIRTNEYSGLLRDMKII